MKELFLISILFFNSSKDPPEISEPPKPPISIRINQRTVYAIKGEVQIHFLIIIEKHPKNRGFYLQWDCPDSGGSSYRALEGEKSKRIFDSYNLVKNLYLTPGTCVISVELERNDGKKFRVVEKINVIDPY